MRALVFVTLIWVTACSSAAQRYREAQTLCVAEHDTRAEIDACRAEVRSRFGVVVDGGAR